MLIRCVVLVLLLALGAVPASADDRAVRFGVFPYVTPVQLVKFHSPLRARLEETLGRPVTLVTAPSFKAFMERTRDGEYDLALTAPHMGRLAQVRDGYQPLFKTGHVVRGIYLVPADSPIQNLQELKGKRLMMGSRVAVMCQLATRQLEEMGLQEGVNIDILTTRTHNNAMFAPLRGESDVSLTGELLFQKTGGANKDKVRIIGQTPAVPGFILVASDQLPPADVARIRAGLSSFIETPEGRAYYQATGFKNLYPVSDAEMEALQPFIAPFVKQSP